MSGQERELSLGQVEGDVPERWFGARVLFGHLDELDHAGAVTS